MATALLKRHAASVHDATRIKRFVITVPQTTHFRGHGGISQHNRCHRGCQVRSESDETSTETLESDIAALAKTGESQPAAAIGMHTRL